MLHAGGEYSRFDAKPLVSVLMPTYGQEHFIERAIHSLKEQTMEDWELIVIDDGSPDGTERVVARHASDQRIRYERLAENRGLGAALNRGLELAAGTLIAYLPSDDVYYKSHLERLCAALTGDGEAVMAVAGVRYHYDRTAAGQIEGLPLQLVQVLHRRTEDRWLGRSELVTDDLERMYWMHLRARGRTVSTGEVTCEWVSHPHQRHKLLQEPAGGINTYRSYYGVRGPLRVHTTKGNHIDEVSAYRRFRERAPTNPAPGGLKIVLAGELAYNPERVLALEERGHKLYGLWMPKPYWYNTVGPLPFGHVEDLPRNDWESTLRRIKPDVIYAQLNWQAVPFLHQVMKRASGIPFVWHFKEGPFICLEKGTWDKLADLYRGADALVYISEEMRDWIESVLPGVAGRAPSLVLDGDLPKQEWFAGRRSLRLSESDGQVHTVAPGRPIGLHPADLVELGRRGIHLHFYGDFTHGQWHGWIEKALRMAGGHLHLHRHVSAENWVAEFSKYDAGWLHVFRSQNHGDIHRANWDDLNVPARISTLAAAGLPLLQWNNQESRVAVQSIARRLDVGVFYQSLDELAAQLKDRDRMATLRRNMWMRRGEFTFDYHAGRLVELFRTLLGQRAEAAD